MNELPAPIAGAKGHMKIHNPRELLRKEAEAKSGIQKGEIQLRVELPQRLQALEARLTAMESNVATRLEEIVAAIERIENSTAHVEVEPRKGGWPKGKPRKALEPAEDEPEAG